MRLRAFTKQSISSLVLYIPREALTVLVNPNLCNVGCEQ